MPLDRLLPADRPVLVAAADALAARLAATDAPTLYADAGQWATQARAVARLLGATAAVAGGTLEVALEATGVDVDWSSRSPAAARPAAAPAFRATPRWTALLGALERLLADRNAGPVVVRIAGPAALARAHSGGADDATLATLKDATVQLAESACRARPDLVLLDEAGAFAGAAPTSGYRKAWSTLRNVARYFDVALGVRVAADPATLDAVAKLQPDALFAAPQADGSLPPLAALAPYARAGAALGVPVDLTNAADARARVAAARAALPARTWLLTTAGDLPADVDIAPLRELVAELGTA